MAGKKKEERRIKKKRERVRVWRKKERKKCHVWRIKKEGEKKEKRIIKYYHNFFTINFKRYVIIS